MQSSIPGNTDPLSKFIPLTRFPAGSIREVASLSLPLMLSALSGALMLFFDRFILAHYSISSMNAALTAGISVAVFQVLIIGIASIAEVFVGHHYGAKEYDKIGNAVWQMIWFSVACGVFILPIALFLPSFFVPERFESEGIPYFSWVLSFSFTLGINAALTAFFIGRGKVKLVTSVVLLGNILNIVGDLVLIFGIPNILEPQGALGAALATVTSQGIQCLILFSVFLNKINKQTFHTLDYAIKIPLFWECFKIGFPSALGHMIEIAAWSIQLHLVSLVSMTHVTVLAIGQSVFGLVAFTTEGLQKGVVAITANLLGAKHFTPLKHVFRSAFMIHLLIALLIVVPLIYKPEWFLKDFLASEQDPAIIAQVLEYARIACYWIFLYFIFDGLVWISAGFLTSAKDTVFILIANAFNAWVFALLPCYWFIVRHHHSPDKVWAVIVLYGFINMLCFLWRTKVTFKKLSQI